MAFRRSLSLSLLCSLLQFTFVSAVTFSVRSVPRSPSLEARGNVSDSTTGNGTVPLRNNQNTQYVANITLNSQTIPVIIDTGSSDLWVAANVPGARDSGKSANLQYAIGQAGGDINFATFQYDKYTVNDQAFLLVTDTKSFSTNIHSQGYDGLIGLGPNVGSVIRKNMGGSPTADTPLNRIFQQNLTTRNFISFLLDRKGDPKDPFTGQMTISEFATGFEKIDSAPKLPVQKVYKLTQANQHWQVLTDKDVGIIGPDGQPIKIKSTAPKAPTGTLMAVIDTGFTLPQVPRAVSDAIYGRVQGARYDSNDEVWIIPCDQYLSVSFNFGGVNFPIHPLDTVTNELGLKDDNGNPICVGAFQPITSAFDLLGEYDMILGMSFLRNAYTLLDFGDFVSFTSVDLGDPYVQMLPLTTTNDGKADFIQTRLNGVDNTQAPGKALLPADQMQHSPISEQERKNKVKEEILSRWPYIFVGSFVLLLIIVGLCVWRCCCRRRKEKKQPATQPAFFSQTPQYTPLRGMQHA